VSPVFLSLATLVAASPKVLILPTITLEQLEKGAPLEPKRVDAFWYSFRESSIEVFSWRRWEVVEQEEAEALLGKLGLGRVCKTAACVDALSKATKATHWVSSVIIRTGDELCRARTTLFDLSKQKIQRVLESDISPCVAQNVLARGEDLGRKIAEGPRAAPEIALDLTPLSVPHLEIPNLPDVTELLTSTAARSSSYPIERALEVYAAQSMIFFEEEGRYYVARGGKVLGDCEVLKVASRPLTQPVIEHCEGNLWELAWIGVGIGGLMFIPSAAASLDGEGGAVAVALTTGTLLFGSLVAAVFFNIDAAVPENGDHLIPRDELSEIVAEANRELRRSLALSEADVVVAGLSP
jgi:hypothetical protein